MNIYHVRGTVDSEGDWDVDIEANDAEQAADIAEAMVKSGEVDIDYDYHRVSVGHILCVYTDPEPVEPTEQELALMERKQQIAAGQLELPLDGIQ